MPDPFTEIDARLRAADIALARATGGTAELAQLRQAVGSLLVAVHALAGLCRPPAAAAPAPPQKARARRQP
jgi:hypothetical protein